MLFWCKTLDDLDFCSGFVLIFFSLYFAEMTLVANWLWIKNMFFNASNVKKGVKTYR